MDNKIFLGCHINLAAPKYYLSTVEQALEFGANTFMFYTGAPQNVYRKDTSELWINEGRKKIQEIGIDESKIVIHAPYIINLANLVKPEVQDLARSFLKQEILRVNDFNVKTLVLHPGSHVNQGKEIGLNAIIDGLNDVLDNDITDVKIAIESMAGKGSELGSSFEELAFIINNVHKKDRVGVCLDTCHLSDAGYDIHNVDALLDKFDKVVGLDKLLVIHINDSKNERGSHKDRHENLGYGHVGFETIYKYVHHPKLTNIPKILETPYLNDKPPYKKEIEMLRNNTFDPDWKYSI